MRGHGRRPSSPGTRAGLAARARGGPTSRHHVVRGARSARPEMGIDIRPYKALHQVFLPRCWAGLAVRLAEVHQEPLQGRSRCLPPKIMIRHKSFARDSLWRPSAWSEVMTAGLEKAACRDRWSAADRPVTIRLPGTWEATLAARLQPLAKGSGVGRSADLVVMTLEKCRRCCVTHA